MPNRMVEQSFCDQPGCENPGAYRCQKCSNSFCVGHRLQVWIGYAMAQISLCFPCAAKDYQCLRKDIEAYQKEVVRQEEMRQAQLKAAGR